MLRLRSVALSPIPIIALLLLSGVTQVNAESLGTWTATTSYPLFVNGVSCVLLSARLLCVGGLGSEGTSDNQTYQAAMGVAGIGSWSASTAYPTPIDRTSCVSTTTGVYCVGGEDGSNVLDDVYFASTSSSGIGSWSSQAAYPKSLAAISCVTYSAYIYCVGGYNDTEMTSAYFAALSPSGLESWTATTQYPVAVDSESCVAATGYIYCVGGETEVGSNQNSPIANVYYAPLSSAGIGQWRTGLSYPTALAAESCVTNSAYIYCVGGFDNNLYSSPDTYYSALSSTGVGQWSNTTPYPLAIDTAACVSNALIIYCVSGSSNTQSNNLIVPFSYFAPMAGPNTTSTTPEFPVTVAIPLLLALGLLVVGGLGHIGKTRREMSTVHVR